MTSGKSRFKFLERGCKKTLLFIPGWATDFRIFSQLNLKYNYLFPVSFNPFYFHAELADFLGRKGIAKISLFGWSLGSFLAEEFIRRYPQKSEEVFLVSVSRQYPQAALAAIKERIVRGKAAFLYKFYGNCFSLQDTAGRQWFRRHLLREYPHQFSLRDLLSGLEYLAGARLDFNFLSPLKKLKIFHGTEDKIAPFSQAEELASGIKGAEFTALPAAGHIPFWQWTKA
jgi:pimeloyl-ACP methyl ester carboxylesterase